MSPTPEIEKRTITIIRTLNASRQLVWDAWTQPEHIAQWWAPQGMDLIIVTHNFTVGGNWEYTMKMPNGQDFKTFGTYSRIEAPALLETSANFLPMTENVILRVEFTEVGNTTEMAFHVIHPTEAYARQQESMGIQNGWGGVFNNLAGYLETL